MEYSELVKAFEKAYADGDFLGACKHGYDLMNRFYDKLDNDKGDEIKEKLLLCAHKLGDVEWTKALWKELDRRHPGSKRVDRLGAIALTTKKIQPDNLKAAVTLMEASVAADPTNNGSRRTLLALMVLGQDSIDKKIILFDEYLRDFPVDVAVWREFGDLAFSHKRLKEAQLAYEELALILDRDNVANWIKLAEICLETGQMLAAMKYFCMAVVFEPFSLEALQGLLNAYEQMMSKKENCYKTKVEDCRELAQCACRRVCDLLEEEALSDVSDETTSRILEKYTALYDTLCSM